MRHATDKSAQERDLATPPAGFVRQGTVWRGRALSVGMLLGIAAVVALGVKFPQELVKLHANQAQIRELQEENADLKKRRDERLERLKNLRENLDTQRLEIQKNLHLYKEGDTIFYLPQKADLSENDATTDSQ